MKILCINGGGIFGIIPAYFLSLIGNEINKIDAFGGTSIGSQLVLAYQNNNTLDTFEFFKDNIYKIFKQSFLRNLNPFTSKYDSEKLNDILKLLLIEGYNEIKKPVIIPTYDIINQKPKIFDNIIFDSDLTWNCWEIARASSSAPTYFLPYKGLIDGGVIANNPSMVTIWALHKKLNIPYEEMELFVLGTGYRKRKMYIQNDIEKWSQLNWLHPMINLLLTGNEQMFNFGCENMKFKKYIFYDPIELDTKWEMDDPNLIPILLSNASLYKEEFKKIFNDF